MMSDFALSTLPPRALLIDALVHEWWLATEQDILDGTAWYDVALAEARTLDGADGEQGAGVIAALSPLTPWGKNVERARLAFQRGEAGGLTFGLHARRADRILNGEHPLDVLGGNKVRSFYHCILGSDWHVTIDRHAFDILVGRPTTDKEKKLLDRKGMYEYTADVYRTVADMTELEPRILQAITWTSWRRRKGVSWADKRNGA